jgi:hypothetical protein
MLSQQDAFSTAAAQLAVAPLFPVGERRLSACRPVVAGLCVAEQNVEAAEDAASHNDQAGEKHDRV